MANATVTEGGGFVLEMRRTFQAERSRVFDAFTKPEALAAWWGPEGVTAPRVELDLRPGGAFAVDMHHEKGAVHYLSGVYEEITPPERLVYSWAWGQGEDKGPSTHVYSPHPRTRKSLCEMIRKLSVMVSRHVVHSRGSRRRKKSSMASVKRAKLA